MITYICTIRVCSSYLGALPCVSLYEISQFHAILTQTHDGRAAPGSC